MDADRAVARLASRQHGLVSRDQARRCGLSSGAIHRRLGRGRWHRVLPRVYRISGAPATRRQSIMAACLSADAFASHRTAAELWGLEVGGAGSIELTASRGSHPRIASVSFHRTRVLARIDVSTIDAIPVTRPARTLVDLAAVVTYDVIEEALDEALRRGLVSLRQLSDRFEALASPGVPGIAKMRRLIAVRIPAEPVPASVLERRFLRPLERAGLPRPVPQYRVRIGSRLAYIDFAYPDARVAIELEGERWHSGRARRQRDLVRQNELVLLGWRPLRFSWEDVTERPDEVFKKIAEALGMQLPVPEPRRKESA